MTGGAGAVPGPRRLPQQGPVRVLGGAAGGGAAERQLGPGLLTRRAGQSGSPHPTLLPRLLIC